MNMHGVFIEVYYMSLRMSLPVLVPCWPHDGPMCCRSTARLSSGQRTALNDIEEVHKEEREGQAYWVYEHTTQV